MKQCWTEGDLRAWLDGELPPAASEQVSTHLRECYGCETLRQELADRAARVARVISALPAVDPMPVVLRMPALKPARSIAYWAVPMGAIAATLLIALLFWSTRA